MNWLTGPIVAFDLETTGTDVESGRIVTAAVVWMEAGEVVHSWSVLADPGVEIPVDATAVHGISTAQARRHGHPAGKVVTELLVRLRARRADTPLIVINGRDRSAWAHRHLLL